jgi:arylsulfatase A-like enzyme
MISALDIGVGEILKTLEKLNLSENTLIILISDNGAGVADYGSNSPLRLGKHTLFEGGVRVPFVMRWPNQLERGLLYKNPVSALDIFPTVLNAAGGKAGSLDLDGVDLLPFLKGEKSDKPHQTFYWRNSPNWAIRDGSYKLINAGGINWLYDLNVDLGETDNIASEYPNVVERLTIKFNEWDAKNIEPSWPPYSAKTHSALKVDGVPIKWTL